jgi:hypothetical protein
VNVTGAEAYDIVSMGGSKHTLQKENGTYPNIAPGGFVSFALKSVTHIIYSITYDY